MNAWRRTAGGRTRRALCLLLAVSFVLRAFSLTAHMVAQQHAFDPLTGLFHHLHECDHNHDHDHSHTDDHDPPPGDFFHDAGAPSSRARLASEAAPNGCSDDCVYNHYFHQPGSGSGTYAPLHYGRIPGEAKRAETAKPPASRLRLWLEAPKNSPPRLA